MLVTNQAGITKGYYSEKDFNELTSWMRERLLREGARSDAVNFCPHHAVHDIGAYKVVCQCRKLFSGMFQSNLHFVLEFALLLSLIVLEYLLGALSPD